MASASFDDVVHRARDTFAAQPMMATLGAELVRVEPGQVEIALPFRQHVTQQNGFVHAAAITAIADTACGCAALTTMPPGSGVLSVEFKLNLLSPAAGERFTARARVVRAGRNLVTCTADVFALKGGAEKQVAIMLATMIRTDAQTQGGAPPGPAVTP